MNVNDAVRLGMIGCGHAAMAHARASLQTEGCIRFTAAADPVPEALARFCSEAECLHGYRTIKEMLDTEPLDGVVIATWPNLHEAHIRMAVEVMVSLPRSLHRQAARAAARDGVSLQEWTLAALAYEMGARQIAEQVRLVPYWWVMDDSTPC